MTPEMSELKFATPQEYIAFLEQQFSSAVNLLQKYEGGEAAMVERLEGKYRTERDQLRADIKQRRERIAHMERQILTNAGRYDFLRQHLVQVWKLGIGATGFALDAAIDDLLRNKGVPRSESNPIADFLTEDNVMPMRRERG